LIHVKTPGAPRHSLNVIDTNLKGVYNCTRPELIASGEASYINGAVIKVDGGMTL